LHGGVGRELDWVLARDGLAEARLEEGLAITARARAQARLLAAVGQLDADSLAPGGTPVEESSSSSEGQASVVPLDSTAARLP